VLHPSTTVFPSVAVPSVGSGPVDKLGLVAVVGLDVAAPTVELAPAMILLASAGEIVLVDVADGSFELGGLGAEPPVRTSDMMASVLWSMKAIVGPITISPPN